MITSWSSAQARWNGFWWTGIDSSAEPSTTAEVRKGMAACNAEVGRALAQAFEAMMTS